MPGNVSLESMLTEIRKLKAARGIGLPARLFSDAAPKVLAGWRARCAIESPSHLRRRPADSAATLLAALIHERLREITDDLAELLICLDQSAYSSEPITATSGAELLGEVEEHHRFEVAAHEVPGPAAIPDDLLPVLRGEGGVDGADPGRPGRGCSRGPGCDGPWRARARPGRWSPRWWPSAQ
jgi:hypothetical protein